MHARQPTAHPKIDRTRRVGLLQPTAHPKRDLRPFDEQNERVFAFLRIGGAVRLVERRTEDAKVEA